MAVAEQTHVVEVDFQDIPELQQFVVANVQPTGRQLGTGAYGSVEEVKIPGATCAAKRIHEILLRMGSVDAVRNITDKFVQECRLMSSLYHPHIVQFLGVCFLPGTQLPALVMERLMMSLDDLLDNNPSVPIATKCSILQDVARGLAYLHSHVPPIIHRDLTAKNVLLNSAIVAKLADLGVARIVDLQPGQLAATMTKAPGTAVYMPPEALEPIARYDTTIDVFSFGNLALYTLTQIFPDLKAATYINSNGRVVARTEVERRIDYIEQIRQELGCQHPMVLMIERCLDNNPQERPTANHILQELEGVRTQIPDCYGQMSRLEMEQVLVEKEGEVLRLEQGIGFLQQRLGHQLDQIQSKDQELQSKDQELQMKDQELQLKYQELQSKDQELQSKVQELRSKDQELQMKDQELQSKCQELKSKDQELQSKVLELHSKDQELQSKDQELQSKDQELQSKNQELQSKDQELQSKDQELQSKDRDLQSKDQELKSKDRELLSKVQELQSQDWELQFKVLELQSKDRELQSKDRELQSKDRELQPKVQELQSKNRELNQRKWELELENQELQYEHQQLQSQLEQTKRLQVSS